MEPGTRVVEEAAARWMTVRSRCARPAQVVQEAARLAGRAVTAVAGSLGSLRDWAPGGGEVAIAVDRRGARSTIKGGRS
jgi:hypothetical protein